MLDLSNLAATLAHPGFWRTVGFTMMGTADKLVGRHFGMPDHGSKLTDLIANDYREQGDHVVTMPYDVKSKEAASKWLNEQIAAFNATM
jgi:hypothetical protein